MMPDRASLLRTGLSMLATATLLAGCAQPAPPPLTCPDIPVARNEQLPDPRPPVAGVPLVLEPAHWDWNASAYVWEQAQWVPRAPGPAPEWMPGFWTPQNGACIWNKPHFLP